MAELKWNPKINGRKEWQKHRRDADFLLRTALELVIEQKLRIDVVIWDKRDRAFLARRQNVLKKVDEWHLLKMSQALIAFVINRWRSGGAMSTPFWSISADRHDGLNFRLLQEKLLDFERQKIGQSEVEIRQEKNAPNYSLQLADVLAGMGAFSHNNWGDYDIWLKQNRSTKLTLPAPQWHTRFPILYDFFQDSINNRMGITLLTRKSGFRGRGLRTQHPGMHRHTINFWPYTLRPR